MLIVLFCVGTLLRMCVENVGVVVVKWVVDAMCRLLSRPMLEEKWNL